MHLVVALAFIALLVIPALAADLRGVPRIIDGDTVVIGEVRNRLHGLHAPELDNPRGWKARDAPRRIVGRRPITMLCAELGFADGAAIRETIFDVGLPLRADRPFP